MTDEQALFAAVLAAPDDDLPRLVYADWIEERGRPERAALIRAHIRRERAAVGSAEYWALIAEAAHLLAVNRERWTAEFAAVADVGEVEFRRGLPEVITLDAGEFVTAAGRLFAMAPIRQVRVDRYLDPRLIADVCRVPRPARVRVATAVGDHYMTDVVLWDEGAAGAFDVDPELAGIEFLPPAPDGLEPHLSRGRWLVLAFRPGDPANDAAVVRAVTFDREAATDGYQVRLAVRPFALAADFAGWCPAAVPSGGPLWLEFDDGRLVRQRTGPDVPAEWQARLPDPDDGDPYDDDPYDGELE